MGQLLNHLSKTQRLLMRVSPFEVIILIFLSIKYSIGTAIGEKFGINLLVYEHIPVNGLTTLIQVGISKYLIASLFFSLV